MFLRQLKKRNPKLINEAVKLYKTGEIEANSYVIDLEGVEKNTRHIVQAAKKYNLNVFAMTKQIGRNPQVAKRIAKAGISKFVAVDAWEAIRLAKEGLRLGNVGHLVQIPEHMIKEIVNYRPEVITVFSFEKALSINRVAKDLNMIQPIILRIISKDDKLYRGQEGGILEKDWLRVSRKILELNNVKIVGLTSFPCFLYDEKSKEIVKTPNMDSLIRAKKLLESKLDLNLFHINAPSVNTSSSMELIAKSGGSFCEPGHALTGTTPLHAISNEVEIPAMLYITEVSHLYLDKAYTFFGGYYRRSHLRELAVFSKDGKEKGVFKADINDVESIDYYGSFTRNNRIEIGDICIYAFRSQIFTSRSQVVLLEGINEENTRISGVYDSQGRSLL